ncbi:unnamed protein product, partial [Scytosiphon promiscuus]
MSGLTVSILPEPGPIICIFPPVVWKPSFVHFPSCMMALVSRSKRGTTSFESSQEMRCVEPCSCTPTGAVLFSRIQERACEAPPHHVWEHPGVFAAVQRKQS